MPQSSTPAGSAAGRSGCHRTSLRCGRSVRMCLLRGLVDQASCVALMQRPPGKQRHSLQRIVQSGLRVWPPGSAFTRKDPGVAVLELPLHLDDVSFCNTMEPLLRLAVRGVDGSSGAPGDAGKPRVRPCCSEMQTHGSARVASWECIGASIDVGMHPEAF